MHHFQNNTFTMAINGHAVSTTEQLPVINPATEAVIAYVPICTPAILDQAVHAARQAFPKWSALPFSTRQQALLQMADALEAQLPALAELLTAEQGKPLADAAAEIGGAAYWLRETATLSLPETVNEDTPGHCSITRHLPLGVVGAIVPWNYPIGLAAFKLSSALLAGNTVILKPSPFTPLTTLKMGMLLQSVLPAGVLNVITGSDELGPWMTNHAGIDKISFTGSTQTGRRVMAGAAQTLKHLTLELGGNDPAIVLPDADISTTAKAIFWAAFGNSGQICLAAKRIYIHDHIYESFKAALVAYASTINMGNGADAGVQLGPIQNKAQYERVLDLLRDAAKKEYTFATGGLPESTTGYFIPVTIVDNPPPAARIVQEEQFGPVLPLLRYTDLEEAIAQANDSPYGLGASVWSGDIDTALTVASRLQAGTVCINEAMALTPLVAFAGHKQSGLGCESGLPGLLAYTQPQTVTTKRTALQANVHNCLI